MPIFHTLWSVVQLEPKLTIEKHWSIDNLSTLVMAGADIYYIDWMLERSFIYEDAFNDMLASPTAFAVACNIKFAWAASLRNYGYDPEEVFVEDMRRRREFPRTHGSK
jgi:hypothetical protein